MLSRKSKPIILLEDTYSENDLAEFVKKHPYCSEIDQFDIQIEELFEIHHPHLRMSDEFELQKTSYIKKYTNGCKRTSGNWVYYPWRNVLVHMLNAHDFYQVKTNRNKLLISEVEQNKLQNFSIGIIGLSIGGVMAQTLARMGFSNKMKLIDFDQISLSNLNRLPHGILSIGNSKALEQAKLLYEIDPYMDLLVSEEKLSTVTLANFFSYDYAPSLIVDAIDDFKMKIQIRLEARKRRIPVVMLTSLGDNLLIDVERYDIDKDYPLFHGVNDEIIDEILATERVSVEIMKKFATQLVGKKNIPKRALESLSQINKTLVGRPQLYSTVVFGSVVLSKLIRKIALTERCHSGRYKKIIV